jgi:hypothetical protein
MLRSPRDGTVLTPDFRDNAHRLVKPNEPVLRIGNKNGPWEIELKIPQKHIAQVLQAFTSQKTEELEVDIILRSAPTRTFRGKIYRKDIGGEATPNRDDNNEAEPVVLAYVRIDDDNIPEDKRLPADKNFRIAGTEVVAKVRCGNRPMGYSLFYGVWEFFYEKVVFFF